MTVPGDRGVLVMGQAARDLVLQVDALPDAGDSVSVTRRIERLGGKGANQAVGLRQLGGQVHLLAVLGTDPVGERMAAEAVDDGIDLRFLVWRGETALLVDVVDDAGRRQLIEHVPEPSLITEADVRAAAAGFAEVDTVCLQLQQPVPALLDAARLARAYDARIVLDGGVEGPGSSELLTLADVLRADDREAAMLTGGSIAGLDDAVCAARALRERGPDIVALAVPERGNVVVWGDDHAFYPHGADEPVDATGAGDAFLAGLVTGLRRGDQPEQAGALAADAAAATVVQLGGRPDLRRLAAAQP